MRFRQYVARERSRFEPPSRSSIESSVVVTHAQSQVLAELLRDVDFDQIVTAELLRRAAVELAPSIGFRGVQFRVRRSGEDDARGGRGGRGGETGRGDVVGGSTRLHARATALDARDRGEGDGSDRTHRVRASSAAASARGVVADISARTAWERRGRDETGSVEASRRATARGRRGRIVRT